jgi:hypothetical protein
MDTILAVIAAGTILTSYMIFRGLAEVVSAITSLENSIREATKEFAPKFESISDWAEEARLAEPKD